jgi:tRNA-2-methylthio-N6-dimethylallyladenosine synthase
MVVSLDALQASQKPRPRRGSYFVQTWGCQMNEEDSEQMARHLEGIGFSPASGLQEAHVILLNTCSVRKKPEDKAFSLLGELALLKQRRPEIIVGVCGCMAQLRADEIKRRNPFVDFIVGTGQIASIPGLVEEVAQARRFQKRLDLPERKGAVVTDVPARLLPQSSSGTKAARSKIKAFVPIQYGCDKFCTFCIVPTTRGRERSRPTEEIVAEVRSLAERGTREVTLLGQTVNSYGKNLAEGRVPFSKLLWLLSGLPGLERIRYTSPYPRDFKADLIECIRDCPKVMEHVHLPLQSGDDDVLRAMRRVYTVESFLEIVANLRRAVPHIGLTTDIIVGFPGETEAQFERTLEVVREIRFDGAYMFIYCPRPGTPAADLEQHPLGVKKGRLRRVANLQNEISVEINRELVGREFEVLVEGSSPKDGAMGQGYSREFKMLHFPWEGRDPREMAGRLVRVRAEASHLWGLSGTILND